MYSLRQRNDQVALNMCTCGKLHFRYGSITLHFEPDDFTAFANAVTHLHTRYKEMKHPQASSTTSSLRNDLCH